MYVHEMPEQKEGPSNTADGLCRRNLGAACMYDAKKTAGFLICYLFSSAIAALNVFVFHVLTIKHQNAEVYIRYKYIQVVLVLVSRLT